MAMSRAAFPLTGFVMLFAALAATMRTAFHAGPENRTACAYKRPELSAGQSTLEASKLASPMLARVPSTAFTALAPGSSGPSSPVVDKIAPIAGTGLPLCQRLDAGSRIWIRLNYVKRRSDRSFTFHKSLLLPVNQDDLVVLDCGTEVKGSGSDTQGQTPLFVTELQVQGGRYILSGKMGVKYAWSPGTGGIIQFNAGRVLEVWLASASTYEKVLDMDLRPQQRKCYA